MGIPSIFDLYVRGLRISRRIPQDSYLSNLPAVRCLQEPNELALTKRVAFLVGENGVGKSTLMEALAIAMGFNPEGGTINFRFSTADSHSELYRYLTVIKGASRRQDGFFLRAESFYNVATQEEQYADAAHPSALYHEKSHGESILQLAQNNLRGDGLYFFDEPEAALSPQRQLTLLAEIYECAKAGAQFFIVTHSPILLGIPDADIYCFDRGTLHLCDYKETDSYQITKMFVNNRQALLRKLLGK